MSSILGLTLQFLFGMLILSITFANQEFRGKRSLMFVFAFPAGFGITSLLMFLSYLLVNRNGYSLCLSLMGLICLFLLIIHPPDITACRAGIRHIRIKTGETTHCLLDGRIMHIIQAFAAIFLIYSLLNFWDFFWTEAVKNPYGGWDGRYFWNLKARFYFRDPGEWRQMFSPLLDSWSHPDYPLMLPGIVAWGWLFRGFEQLTWPLVVGLVYTLSLFSLVFWYLYKNANFLCAAIATGFMTSVYMFYYWSTTHYADIPLALYMTASAVFLITALRGQITNLFFLSGLCAGLSVWTKDEGYFFLIFITIIFILILLRSSGLDNSKRKERFLLFVYGALIPVLCSLLIKTFLTETGGQYAGSGRSFGDFVSLIFAEPEKTRFIALAFGVFAVNFQQWNGLWILFLIATLIAGRKGFSNYRWVSFALTLMILGGYFVILHITPHDLRFQISSALMRIMSHAAPLAVIFTFESIGTKLCR